MAGGRTCGLQVRAVALGVGGDQRVDERTRVLVDGEGLGHRHRGVVDRDDREGDGLGWLMPPLPSLAWTTMLSVPLALVAGDVQVRLEPEPLSVPVAGPGQHREGDRRRRHRRWR